MLSYVSNDRYVFADYLQVTRGSNTVGRAEVLQSLYQISIQCRIPGCKLILMLCSLTCVFMCIYAYEINLIKFKRFTMTSFLIGDLFLVISFLVHECVCMFADR